MSMNPITTATVQSLVRYFVLYAVRRQPQGVRMIRPVRCFTLSIEIGGDTWEDVIADLRDLARHIEQHGPACSSVMGGPSSGHTVGVSHRLDQTHEKYIAELAAYIAAMDTEKADPTGAVGGGGA